MPSELEIMKQEFERKNLELEKRIAKLEEEKMYLSLDIDVQKMEVKKERKEKRKIEEDRDDLKEHYKKAQVSLRRAKIEGSSNQLQKEVQEGKVRVEYWEKNFQEMQSRNLALEEENKGLKSKVTELGRSLRWHRNHDSKDELKELKSKVEDLEAAFEEGKLQIEQLETQRDYLKGELHQSRGQIREMDHLMEEAIAQIREVAEYVQDLAVRADVLSRKEKLEITHPYGTRTKTKSMDQRFEQLQKDMQDQLQEQLAKMQNEMREQMMEAQRNIMAEMAQLLRATDKGKAPMAITKEENEGPPPGFTPLHVSLQTEAPPRRPSTTVRPQHGPIDAGVHVNFPIGSGLNMGDNLTNPLVPDLDMVEKEDLKAEAARQLDERCRWLEEKFKALEGTGNNHGVDAKDLSLVPNLVLPHKFKMPEFEKYNGTTCPEAHITMFCRRMTGYVNNDQLLIYCFQDSLIGAAARWYNQLGRARISSWRDLAQAFMQQYNHRWREVAMQVQPPLLEKETTMLFINTLKAPFITHMIGSTTKSFTDIVMAGEMIENAIRGGRIEGEVAKRSAPRRKDNEVNNTSDFNSKAVTVSQPKVATVGQQGSQKQESNTRELYQNLYDAHAIAPFHLKPLQPPYPKWYDANAICEYHAGISGHSIENCTGFKKAVERLIKNGVLKFESTSNTENPLPNHDNQGVNAIGEADEKREKEKFDEIRMPMRVIWEEMMKSGMLTSKNTKERTWEYGKFREDCEEFKALVQGFIDNKELQVYEGSSSEKQVCVLENEQQRTSRPKIIISLPGNNKMGTPAAPKVIIHTPTPFPYKDSKKVPWSYDYSVTVPGEGNIASASKDVRDEGSHTRSGKRYDMGDVRVEPAKPKNVEIEKRSEVPVNEPVREKEAKEFLKFLKHSEYSLVEQLCKQPARISVLALLLSSEVHREVLLKVLNETYVTHDISVRSPKALHITTRCKGYTLPSVFIDNGSALNVLPLSTLNRLPIDSSHMKTCHNVVRAFDGTERKVMGRIDIPLEIGPNTYELVIDGRLVTINAEKDIIAAVTSKAPYVETNEEAIECSFRSLEIVNATFISEGSEVLVPKISRATRMALQVMMGKGALPGK
ncbi:uncharacterized protein [Gossypium hirsutum]|uniref:Retrotransposon gag domain-containing protein n=1 Tax=Gossypium hirsutum TaxID=3635 RepID=A0ABM2YNH5_GOSHI|nr:uncharacterized protein LOC121206003 [Gossypium hirsutum]